VDQPDPHFVGQNVGRAKYPSLIVSNFYVLRFAFGVGMAMWVCPFKLVIHLACKMWVRLALLALKSGLKSLAHPS